MRTQTCLALMACFVAGSLSGCSYAPHETRAAYEPVTDSTSTAKPLALLPAEGGAIVAVLESRVSGIYTQRIIFSGDAATDGENAVILQIDETDRPSADLTGLPKPTEDGIARELEASFPSVGMQISRAWAHNDFGPFGYATGQAPGGVTCIYAWQYSQGAMLHLIDDAPSRAAAASMPSKPTSIRVRLCRQGLSESELVTSVRAMQVYPLGGGAPFHDTLYSGIGPLGAGDALQAAGAPGEFFLRPNAAQPPVRKHKASKAQRHVAHHRASPYSVVPLASSPVSRPMGSVVVPLPTGSAISTEGAANPLLAPLQAAPRQRASIANDDMPLPGATVAPSLGSTASPRSASTIPLPN